MTAEDILLNLQILCNQFINYDDNWVNLKNQSEFVSDVDHNSPIRKLYSEGRGCASYLKGRLDTSHVNKSVLIDEYVANVKAAIPPEHDYKAIGQAAQKDYEANYRTNYTVQYMLRQYWDQEETIKRVEQFLDALTATSAYQPLAINPAIK